MANRIEVLIADDHEIVRFGLRQLMEGQEDMKVVEEAETGVEAVEKTCELKPDVATRPASEKWARRLPIPSDGR